MKTPVLFPILALGLLASVRAARVDFSHHYETLALKDGRTLQNVDLENYDTQSGRVGVLADGTLTTVAIGNLPEDVAGRITALVQTGGQEPGPAATQPASVESPEAPAQVQTRTITEPETSRAVRHEWTGTKTETASEDQDAIRARVSAEARRRAEYHFRYEADPHSSTGYVGDANVMLEEPEPVPGWTNRWRVRGKVGTQYVTRDAGSVGRTARDFEVLIEAPPDGPAKLVDITITR